MAADTTNAAVRRVGYAGLGEIGAPMAERIRQAGFELHVWNRSPAKAAPLVAAGARLAATPAELAARVQVLCLCLTDDKAVEQVVFGAEGIAASPAVRGLVLADHSTIHPLATRRLASRLADRGGRWVDAPVSGGVVGARQGTLAVFAGGEAAAVERMRPVAMSFASRVTHLGPEGSGQVAKICNQMVSFSTCAVLAEALHLATRMGLDVAQLPQAMQGGLADSAVLRHYAPELLSGQLQGSSLNALKDLEIALDLSRDAVSATPMTALLTSLHRMVVAQGHTALGMGGPLRLYADGGLQALAERLAAEREGGREGGGDGGRER